MSNLRKQWNDACMSAKTQWAIDLFKDMYGIKL